ncbi:MAG: ribosome biogenesis GTPase YlqF [Clostridia bacterium]|jgi:ribosome biogenesis GTPase A
MKQIQWYPGHMAKTKRLLQENLSLVDVVVEMADARIPKSSINPDFDVLLSKKPRIIAFNKSDLADPEKSALWKKYFQEQGIPSEFIDCKTGKGIQELFNLIKKTVEPVLQKDLQKGRVFRLIKVMVTGIPNTGKSTFINRVAKNAATKTGNKPGITKGKQWVRANREMMILDTPGILWPKFEDEETAVNLAFTGAISDDILDLYEISCELLRRLGRMYPNAVSRRYNLEFDRNQNVHLPDLIAAAKGCLKKGGEPDYDRVSKMVLDDFRAGRFGKITLEMPEDRGDAL